MRFDWLWQARFSDGKVICQDPEDKYSKHDDSKDWNPSSFRDFLDYFNSNRDKLTSFGIVNSRQRKVVVVRFDENKIRMFKYTDGDVDVEHIHDEHTTLYNVQPIYYRKMQNRSVNGVFGEPEILFYTVGYQGQDGSGRNIQYTYDIRA